MKFTTQILLRGTLNRSYYQKGKGDDGLTFFMDFFFFAVCNGRFCRRRSRWWYR